MILGIAGFFLAGDGLILGWLQREAAERDKQRRRERRRMGGERDLEAIFFYGGGSKGIELRGIVGGFI